MRIEPGGNDDQFGAEFAQLRQNHVLERGTELRPAVFRSQRRVDDGVMVAALAAGAGTRKQRHLVRRAIHHTWIGPENILSAVTVMHVEIDNRRPSDSVFALGVTGGNRGIGFEVCRQLAARGFTVVLTARDAAKARAAATKLAKVGTVEPLPLDVADANSIKDAAAEVASRHGRLDVLINNAGINYDTWETVENADINGTVMETIATNLLGPWRLCQAFLPLLRKSQAGRIVNVSSESGSLAEMGTGPPAYQVTKAALNALTRTLAGELRGAHIS